MAHAAAGFAHVRVDHRCIVSLRVGEVRLDTGEVRLDNEKVRLDTEDGRLDTEEARRDSLAEVHGRSLSHTPDQGRCGDGGAA